MTYKGGRLKLVCTTSNAGRCAFMRCTKENRYLFCSQDVYRVPRKYVDIENATNYAFRRRLGFILFRSNTYKRNVHKV